METIKIIDLLNKIANDEEIPKKIKYFGLVYEYCNRCKQYEYNDVGVNIKLFEEIVNLTDTVEIIEEEPRNIEVCGSLFTKSEYDKLAHSEEEKKIPEKLKDILRIDDLIPPIDENMYKIWTQTIKNQNKINEILDYLESKGE